MARKGFVQPLVLAALLAGGFGVAWAVAGLWAAEVGTYVLATDRPGVRTLVLLADGTPLVAEYVSQYGEREYRDLDGSPVPAPEEPDFLQTAFLPAALREVTPTQEVPWDGRLHAFADGRVPATYWYFVSDGRPAGTGYFVGYDSKSKLCVGYLGTAGPRPTLPPAGELFPFGGVTSGPRARLVSPQMLQNGLATAYPERPVGGRAPRGCVSPWDVYVLGRGGKLYHADLQARSVELVRDDPGLRSAGLIAGVHDPVRGTPVRLAVRTDDAVLLLDEQGREVKRYPIPEALLGENFSLGETTTGQAVAQRTSPDDERLGTFEHRIYWVEPSGATREAAVTLPTAGGSIRGFEVLAGAVLPSPVGMAGLVGVVMPGELLDSGAASSYGDALRRTLARYWPGVVLAQALAAVFALLCYRRQVRYAAPARERLVWPLFVLVLGWPGWVGYRFGRSWPVLERCPACDVAAPRDRESCARCEVEFPGPVLKGTEVFA